MEEQYEEQHKIYLASQARQESQPYVGVTGVKSPAQVKGVVDCFARHGLCQIGQGSYQGMLGFLVSQKRLAQRDIPGDQSPAAKDLADLCALVPDGLLPMMHYHTAEKDTLVSQVKELFSVGSMYDRGVCRALQLNVDWPPVGQVEGIMDAFPEMRIVLQLPRRATEGRSVEEIAGLARPYAPSVAYALIDPSGGEGIPFDIDRSVELMLALHEALPGVVIGAAGGLRGETVRQRVEDIRTRYLPPFCIDAQGGLRDIVGGSSVLNLGKVDSFVRNAVRGLESGR